MSEPSELIGWTVHVWPTWDGADPDGELPGVFSKDFATMKDAFTGIAGVFAEYPGAFTELHLCVHQTGVVCSCAEDDDE